MGLNIKKISNKKITRKEFLVYLGVVVITISGIPSLINSILGINPKKSSISKAQDQRGFGSGPYGV